MRIAMPTFWVLLLLIGGILMWRVSTAVAQNATLIVGTRGWIVAGSENLTSGDLPSCSYCLNILGVNNPVDFGGHKVAIFRCLKFDYNELWAHNTTTSELRSVDRLGNVTCLEASRNADFKGRNITYLNNFFMAACDGSRQQQWFLDSGTKRIRSALKSSRGEDLFLVQGKLPAAKNPALTAGYNLYLSTEEGFNASSDFMSSSFLYLPTTNYNNAALIGGGSGTPSHFASNLVRNGGFERTTLLNQSSIFYNNEVFSLCGWVIVKPPKLIPGTDWTPAQGNSSLLLSQAAINQTIETQASAYYLLSFALAGYLQNTAPFTPCVKGSLLDVTVVGRSSDASVVFNASTKGWQVCSVRFRASSNVIGIIFKATDANDPCGPLIDDVQLVKVVKPFSNRTRVEYVVGGLVCGLVLLLVVPLGILSWRRHYYANHLLRKKYGLDRVKLYSWKEIKRATKNFSTVIGEGGFSMVYKADFGDGILGAAKVEKEKQNTTQFAKEVCLLQQIHYRSLVNLHGVCFGKGKNVMVFEYMEKGSLYDRLHRKEQPHKILPWGSRMKICYQVACALEYLHHHTTPPIVHRDIKSANILLTSADDAKLADFGLSKTAPKDAVAFESIQTDVKGSLGYLDPKYMRSGVFSTRSDVYSYGVVLLEIITGHRAIKESDLLPFWAAPYLANPAMASQMVDVRLGEQYDSGDLAILVELVIKCLQDESEMRPSMQQILSFFTERRFTAAPPLHGLEPKEYEPPIAIDSKDFSLGIPSLGQTGVQADMSVAHSYPSFTSSFTI